MHSQALTTRGIHVSVDILLLKTDHDDDVAVCYPAEPSEMGNIVQKQLARDVIEQNEIRHLEQCEGQCSNEITQTSVSARRILQGSASSGPCQVFTRLKLY